MKFLTLLKQRKLISNFVKLAGISAASSCSFLAVPLFQKIFLSSLTKEISSESFVWLALSALTLVLGTGLNEVARSISLQIANYIHGLLSSNLDQIIFSAKFGALKYYPRGRISALLTQDITNIVAFFEESLSSIVFAAVQLSLAPIALALIVKASTTTCVLALIPGTIISILLGIRHAGLFRIFKLSGDKRLSTFHEYLGAHDFLTVYKWVGWFQEKIINNKNLELKARENMAINGTFIGVFAQVAPISANLVVFYYLIHNVTNLSAGNLFAAYWVCSVFLLKPYRQIPVSIVFLIDAFTSWRRIQETSNDLQSPKTSNTKDFIHLNHIYSRNGQVVLEILDTKDKKIILITGPSGSGKTLLLSTIAEAAEEHSSRVNFCFAGEYGAIFEGTLEENILLEQKCSSRSLTNSITNIFGLNEMNINSEGKNLSGGMKQRLLLARIYSQNPDLIILDNSFSALDPHSFNKITSYLLNDIWSKKTVIIASNDKRLEVFANQIFTIENGQIVKMHPKI